MRFPHLQLVVGLGDFTGGVSKAQERIGAVNSDEVARRHAEAILEVRSKADSVDSVGKALR